MLKKFLIGLLKSVFGIVFLLFTLSYSIFNTLKDETVYTQKTVDYTYDFLIAELPGGLLDVAKTLPNAETTTTTESDTRELLKKNLSKEDLRTFVKAVVVIVKDLEIDKDSHLKFPVWKVEKQWKVLVEKFAVVMYQAAYDGELPALENKRELTNNLYEKIVTEPLPSEFVVNFSQHDYKGNFVGIVDRASSSIFWIAITIMSSILIIIGIILKDDWRALVITESRMLFSSSLSLIILGVTLYFTSQSLIEKTTDFALGKFMFGFMFMLTTMASMQALWFVGPICAGSLFVWLYFRYLFPKLRAQEESIIKHK
ncbi:MAG: hypothetical protein AAB373_05895 [Patescibacteria group bacterium]